MPRLSRIQAQTQSKLRALAGSALPAEQLANRLLSSLEEAIGWDGFRLFGNDSTTLLINRLLAASENDAWARREWLSQIYLSNEALLYIEIPNILRARLGGVAYQEHQGESWGYPQALFGGINADTHWRYFHESQSPVGGVLLAGFASEHRWIAAMQACRRDPRRPFRKSDVDFLRLSGPLIGQALGTSLSRERAMGNGAGYADEFPDASGIVLVAPTGEVQFVSPAGEQWIETLRSREPRQQGMLPTALWSAMRGLTAQGRPAARVVVQTIARQVNVEASAGDESGTIAIVINPKPRPEPRSVPEWWGLTDQQRRIVLLVVASSSNRAIAESLFVSDHTVEWHLRQIYGRLGIRSQTQLLSRFFQDAMLGDYREPPELG